MHADICSLRMVVCIHYVLIKTFTIIPLVKFQSSTFQAKTMDKYCSSHIVLVIEIYPFSNLIQKPSACIKLTPKEISIVNEISC